jgi:hypothetical protein
MGMRRPADDLSSNLVDGFRHAGTYVAKSFLAPGPAISRIEQSSRLTFVINLKTALGITVPPALLSLAADVIVHFRNWAPFATSGGAPSCACQVPFPARRPTAKC